MLKWLMMFPSWIGHKGKGVRDIVSVITMVAAAMYDTQ